ncbi:ankyrin and armadillo repeat-containing protein-like [Biomphalaria glabrata]|uniref:Ankyrin and armadillo repeat-containing protein-like n=1 Tax=Biomphalaria glabrata TaxID=6526 RepID=A0A9W2ZB90_BIOGL|nr:ankyrin and armadillo repeat-containing protein-like [Biomphalaria glabrata]XP_055872250.1 ankyrin and armadillo repeat-containing protein-like [Biomphalaria glabrata]
MSLLSEDEALALQQYARVASVYLDKLERYDSQELLSSSMAHWLLSNDIFRMPTEQLMGLVSQLNPVNDTSILLFPVDESISPLCYREVHNIIRELTLGIYIFHQTPMISLEANFDQATICQLPPAYINTKIGQLLISVDYMMKALWHGGYFPKEKRTKFGERWRTNLDVNLLGVAETKKNLLSEFTSAGLMDITKDPDFITAYDSMPAEVPDDLETMEDIEFFMKRVDDINMRLTFTQDKVFFNQNIFMIDAKYDVSSIIKIMDTNIDLTGYERLKSRLHMQEEIIQTFLGAKQETRRQLELLKIISYLVPFLLGMRKKMRIPDINRLMSPYNSDECRTERELPPLMVGPDFKCKNFMAEDSYFHLHGGINFDLETNVMQQGPEELEKEYENICDIAMKEYLTHTSSEQQRVRDHYNIPTVNVNGKLYYAIVIEFEVFYSAAPQKPLWVRAYCEEMDKMKPKRLPVADLQIHEQFKRQFGSKKAIKYKTPMVGLKICAQQGLIAMFSALTRKISGTRIGKQDEQGMSLIHYAAIYNRPQIITLLILQSVDINVRRNNILSTGPTALHMAARCGSLDAACCLVSNHANMTVTDQNGWTPIHYAAFFDHKSILTMLLRKSIELLELTTANELQSTPLLLAASSGALSAVKCLIDHGADIQARDTEGNNVVILATLRFHTSVLEYFIKINNEAVPVWRILVEMLNDDSMEKKDSAVKCLETLTTSNPNYWKCILDADGVPALVKLLQIDSDDMQSVAASVICNISENDQVRLALSKAKAAPVLIILLSSNLDDIQSRTAIILSDIACVENNQTLIAECGGIPPLVQLLYSDLEDVLVNAVNCIRVLCINNTTNQKTVAECGGLEHLVEFLAIPSEDLQAGAAAALSAACSKNIENQNRVISEGARPLVELISDTRRGDNRKGLITVQVKAASAIEALASLNPASQKKFLELGAPNALMLLLKDGSVDVREQGACALWALAGNTKTQQKNIAERITITHIIQMLLEPTEKLLNVGCMMAIALGSENIANQNKLAAAGAFSQLVRLLRSPKTSIRVLLKVIKVLGILCTGVAYQNNKVTQGKIADEGGLPVLVNLLAKPPNDEIQVEVAFTLGTVILSNHENQEKLAEEATFKFDTLLTMLRSKDEEICLRAGMALTIFAFNNTPQQMNIKQAGGISYDVFDKFIQSNDEFYQCYASFQIVVLARVITDKDQVSLTAQGIMMLVSKLSSAEENVVVLSCSLLAALSHTRAGLTDAMITCGALDLLVHKLDSPNDLVRNGAAVALGYLTFNKTAYRLLFSLCRNVPNLFDKIMKNIGEEPKISQEFIEDFQQATRIGLPTQCLEINGGHSLQRNKTSSNRRPKTGTLPSTARSNPSENKNRAVSAPPMSLRHRSKHTLPEIIEPVFKKGTSISMRSTSSSVGFSSENSSLDIKPADINK